MPPCGPDHDSSESALVIGSAVAEVDIPVSQRRVIDKGPHMEAVLHKRGKDRLDYYIPIPDPSDTITGVTGRISPVTDPPLAILQIFFSPTGAIVWLAGGKDQARYDVDILIVTAGGKRHLCRFALVTNETAPPGPLIDIDANQQPNDAIVAGIGPLIAFSPPALALPTTAVGERSAWQSITVSNPGTQRLALRSIEVTGPFAFTSDTTGYLDPGDTFILRIRFEPTAAGSQTGILTLDGNRRASLALSALAI